MPDLVMAAAAAVAGISWAASARARRPYPRWIAVWLASWGATAAVARLTGGTSGDVVSLVSDTLLLIAAVLVLVGVAWATRMVSTGSGPAATLAEAALVGTSMVTLAWAVIGAPVTSTPPAVLAAAPAVVDLATSSLVLRLSGAATGRDGSALNRRRLLITCLGVYLVTAADVVHGVTAFGAPIWPGVEDLTATAGYLCGALVPWVGRAASPVRAYHGHRAVPFVLVTSAVLAVCIQAVLGRTGPVPVVLVTLVVASMVALQALAVRENSRLVRDLETSRQRLAALVENTSDLIVRLDENGRVLAANAAAERLLHRTPVSLIGRSFDDVARVEDRRQVREAVLTVARGRTPSAQVELRLAYPATGTAQLRLSAVPGGAVANLNDITDAVELRQRLERMARYDQMTGLVNRAHLLDVVGAWLSEPQLDVAVLYADLDGFKAVNDRFGHAAGDRVLAEVAVRLEAVASGPEARRSLVGRVGGDEFVVAIEGTPPEALAAAGERVVDALRPSFTVGDHTLQLGVSVGVAWAGGADDVSNGRANGKAADKLSDGSDLDWAAHGEAGAAELMHRADLAMYQAKAAGRGRVALWEPAFKERARRRVDIAIGLRRALDTGQLAVAYQPIVRLVDGRVIGAEALLRSPRPDGVDPGVGFDLEELVSPAELVAVAEDTGSITEMGEWVLAQAVQQAAEWAAQGLEARVSVNMSVQQLISPGFVEAVTGVLEACELPAERLVLELTENQLAGETGPAVPVLERLRDIGVQLAIDDFGTGYSSLAYLRRMPVHMVKIDRTLLDGIGEDPRATALVRSVVGMARDLGLWVVAEGMEDMATVRLLRDLGAQAGQGFALSRAVPAQDFAAVLAGPALDLSVDGGREADRTLIKGTTMAPVR